MKIQIDDLVRDATADEAAQLEAQHAAAAEHQAAADAKAAALASARVKLAKLGLTDAELEAFLGI